MRGTRARIAGFIGRTVWNTSPAISTMSGRERDHAVDRTPERLRDVRFALVDSGGRQPVVLPEAEMEVGEVYEAHRQI